MSSNMNYVWEFRKFKSLDSLDIVVGRKFEKARNVSEKAEILIAADHRRAEIAAGLTYDPGKVPTSVWKMI